MNLDVDLATNRALAKTIIELIRIIVDIENSTQYGDKPALSNLNQQLQKVYGIISMSQYALDNSKRIKSIQNPIFTVHTIGSEIFKRDHKR